MKKFLPAVVFSLLFFTATTASAGCVDTYGIGSKAAALGGAYGAYADDVFAVYYNPAGLTQIDRPTVAGGLMVMDPTINVYNYDVTGGVASNPTTTPYSPVINRYNASNNLTGPKNFNDDSSDLYVPHMGFAMPLTEKVSLGIAVYVPWGLELEWKEDPARNPGAYNCYHSYYMREAVTPTVAYQVNEKLSLGFGISVGKSKSGADRVIATTGLDPDGTSGNVRQEAKSEVELEDSLNYSFNVGLMYKPIEALSLGATFRSQCDAEFDGEVKITNPDGSLFYADAEMNYDHPAQLQFGVRYVPETHPSISLEADLVWTNWSINSSQDVTFDRQLVIAGVPSGITAEYFKREWEDTKQFRFGAEWKTTDIVTLRCGYFYDPSPIPDDTMDLIWPDADKKTYSVGFGLNFENITIDGVVTYSDIERERFVNASHVIAESYENPYNHADEAHVTGKADGKIWGYGLTCTYKF